MTKRSIDAISPDERDPAEIKRARRDTFLQIIGQPQELSYMPGTPVITESLHTVPVTLNDEQYVLQRLMQELDPQVHALKNGEVKRINRIRADLLATHGAEMHAVFVVGWKGYLAKAPMFPSRISDPKNLDEALADCYLNEGTADLGPTVIRHLNGVPAWHPTPQPPPGPLLENFTMRQYILQEAMNELSGTFYGDAPVSAYEKIRALRREAVETLAGHMHPLVLESWKKYFGM